MSDNVKAGSLQPAGPQLLPAATQAAASPAHYAKLAHVYALMSAASMFISLLS